MLAFFFLGTIFYRQSFLVIMIVLLFVLPIISIALLKGCIDKLQVNITCPMESVCVGYDSKIIIEVKNDSSFPFLNSLISFDYQNLFYQPSPSQTITVSAQAKKTVTYTLPFHTRYPGLTTYHFSQLCVTDYLHLLTIYIDLDRTLNLPVFPKDITLSKYPIIPTYFEDDSDEDYSNSAFAQKSNDIREVREYQPGDLIRDIHWKMSTRANELMIKEYEHITDHKIYIVTELYNGNLEESLETLLAYGKHLILNKEPFVLAIFTSSDASFSLVSVTCEEDLYEGLIKLYYSPSYNVPSYAKDTFALSFGLDKHFVYINNHEVTIV